MKLVWILVLTTCAGASAAAADGEEYFEKNVRPLFAQQCQACHSSPTAPMGGLRLDSREALLKGGAHGPAIVPGKPAESMLLRAVRHTDALRMPPSGKLKDAQIAALAQWIEMGAPCGATKTAEASKQKFWAFVPPKEPSIPQVKNADWAKSPIDAFILAALEAKGLAPAPAADKRTLLRRATFDLTGLPPSPEELQSFLADTRPDAFAQVIDRLLASPRYGERWGRHWLDVARYADSNGLDENLVYRHAYRYRDYVIQAFNRDKPYDLFVREQLAGDLLPVPADDATVFERWTATGFLSLGAKMLAEDDPVKMEMDIVDEQLDTTARTFMGLTVGCARCHDHKFDPIPTADYYSMAGIFKSSKTMENFKVVAKWHEYVLAPEPERNKLQAHLNSIEAKNKEMGRIAIAQNNALATEARARVSSYLLAADDLLRYEKIRLQPAASGGAERTAASFERGNAPRALKKGDKNVPSGAKEPFFAEYDLAASAAGEYQLDMLEEETGGGTLDVWVNGVLEQRGKGPVTNREASPDAGGWSVTGVFLLKAGENTVRLEHKSRFPYFEALRLSPLPGNSEVPRSPEQVARQYNVNPGFLKQWVDETRRSIGAPNSILYPLFAFARLKSFAGDALSGWTSPAAARFRGFLPKTRDELAARYQELFVEADGKWQETKKALPAEPREKVARNAVKREEGLADATLEPFREMSYAKAGPFRPPMDARQYYPPDVRAQLDEMEKDRNALEAATPDLPRAMGVREGEKIADLPIHIRGSHWTLGDPTPRRFLRVVAGDNQPPIPAQ
ncbi:MAG: DUF1549 domain-containing protein, partial [Bryobacteraceae bacterium]